MSSKLQTEEKQKRQITADVAHELRTPLSNLQENLEAMLDGIWEPTQERLVSCHEEIIRLASIVKQMQVLYSLENRKEKLNYEIIDVKQEEKEKLYKLLQYALYDGSQYIDNDINEDCIFEYRWFDNYFTDNDRNSYFIKSGNAYVGMVMVGVSIDI